MNAGSGGWTIGSQAIFFEERGRWLAPEQVVVGFSSNDLTDLERGGFVFEGQQNSVGSVRGPVGRAIYESALYELALRFRVWWKHLRETRAGTHGDPLVSFDPTPERKPALWAQYAEWLDRLHAHVRDDVNRERALHTILTICRERFGVSHVTVQIEHGRCADVA